ncbi:hypothetical protein PO883_18910 [Massilia sp. DJPM01]|uniref:hypothetical protein n=1 Tax=Massilia sp. DJPM01 TaxID=3024404 RepID=UPI00259F9D1A|nr:hypothetical protein [Massilia sp. DJPM01]MDM5179266.1 hypothetical protein [Massilia sp. DJPM01]
MNMLSKDQLKALTIEHLDEIMGSLNDGLSGIGLDELEPTITRLGRGGKLPHWFAGLKNDGRLPNFDGKTVGSILEMVFVAVLEQKIKVDLGHDIAPLKINPARGVDLPDLDLGIKSPSKNFCTSEPFFTAYERLHGSEFDALVLLTDYQEAKKKSRLTLQITDWKYLKKTEIADFKLCRLAFKHREWLLADDEQRLQRLFRFLAYVNQSDWRATQLLKLVEDLDNEEQLKDLISSGIKEFERQNKKREKTGVLLLPDTDRQALEKIQQVQPLYVGVLEAAENWVLEVLKDAARAPSGAEWHRLKTGALDGKIGMSFALQWRYNFANIFRAVGDLETEIEIPGQLDLDQDDGE